MSNEWEACMAEVYIPMTKSQIPFKSQGPKTKSQTGG